MVCGFLNWATPCGFKANFQKEQAFVAGHLASENMQSMTAVLVPTFAWQPGQLYLQEQTVMKQLTSQNVNVDRTAWMNTAFTH
eukprot:11451421-Alexandrium_andersonii.AAC.1